MFPQASLPPDPPAFIWVLRTEPFDPKEAQAHPLHSLPETLSFHTQKRAVRFHPGQPPPPNFPAVLSVSWTRPRPWLHPIPDGLVALAVDVLVGCTGGNGSMLAGRADSSQDVPRRTPLESLLH